MSAELDELLQKACRNIDQLWQLVDALRHAATTDPAVLVRFARSENKVARRAAASAGAGNTNPYVQEALTALAGDPELEVRQELAYACKNCPDWPMVRALERLLTDPDPNTRQVAAWASQKHAGLVHRLLDRLAAEEDAW